MREQKKEKKTQNQKLFLTRKKKFLTQAQRSSIVDF
jgi:hypothetical protein